MNISNLFDVVDSMEQTAQIAALRGITNSALAKTIGAIRQDMRDRSRAERNTDEPQTDIDQRNAHDEAHRLSEGDSAHFVADEAKVAFGFNADVPALKQASQLHAVYSWAYTSLMTLSVSRWDEPLEIDRMLEFMTSKARPLDAIFVRELAKAAKTTEDVIRTMHELQDKRDREILIEQTPEIKLTFNGFGDNGYENSISDLPKMVQHQFGVKVVEALHKAKDNVLGRVLRTRRISDLASIPLLENGIAIAKDWVEKFEAEYDSEITDAIANGINLRTLDDVMRP